MDNDKTAIEALSLLGEQVEKGNTETADKIASVIVDASEAAKKVVALEEKLVEANTKFEEAVVSIEADASKSNEEQQERIAHLESLLASNHGSSNKVDYHESEEHIAMNAYAVTGQVAETLRTDINSGAGYLVVPELDNVIQKSQTELDPTEQFARVRTIGTKSIELVKRTGIPTVTSEGEAEAGGDSQSSYGKMTMTPFRYTFSTAVTRDQLLNSHWDIATEMSSDAAEAFAFRFGNDTVVGDGVKKAFGFMVDADVIARSVLSEHATKLTYAGMANCIGGLKSGFLNARYFFNRLSFVELLKLVSTTGEPIWKPGMNGVAGASIFGYGYTLMESMPNIGAGTRPVVLADLGRGYTVVNRTGLSVIRDETSPALRKAAMVEFTWDKYQTGDVNDAEAFVPLEIGV